MKFAKVWIAYEKNDLSLPIAVANTARELAEMVGVQEKTVRTEASRWRTGSTKSKHEAYAMIKVEVDDETLS